MSEQQTDSYDSRPVTSKKLERPPFKLCFSRNQQIGKSDACISKTNADLVTPKFYSRELEDAQNADVSDTLERLATEQDRKPRNLYQSPLLTSHTYGWWHDKGIHPKDARFDFHKRTSDLVSFQMKIYAEDRKLKGLKHHARSAKPRRTWKRREIEVHSERRCCRAMSSGIAIEHTKLHKKSEKSRSSKSQESSESKRLRLDNGCNNNLNNSHCQNSTKWPYSGDASLIEPEILEDMGVSMLEDGVTNCENTKKLQSEECTILAENLTSNNRSAIDDSNIFGYQEEVYTSSSLGIATSNRVQQDSCDTDDLIGFGSTENESGYSSRMEAEYFGDLKESFSKEKSISAKKNEQSCLDQFCLFRRKRRPSIYGEDKFNKLSDEIILMILKWLPKKCLVRSMLVCKRWCQIAQDEALWTRLDMGSKVLNEGTLGHILPRGIQILRLAQAEIADPVFCEGSEVLSDSYISKLQYLDLSMAVISPMGLAVLLSKCKYLKKLSLEKCVVNRDCCRVIKQNTELEILNLTMCENINVGCIMDLMELKCLTALNIAWCSLDNECITLLCKTLPTSITRLNLAGCRKTMTDENVKDLLRRCPDIIELDLSDCAMLTMHTVHNLLNFSKLEHLSLSRCYSIPQSAYIRLATMPCLLYLDVFGLMTESVLKSLQATCREPEINKYLYSSVARPTVGIRRTSIWGLRVRD
ncbi:S-phase kinase-associated protein 2 [Cyphomyrmex costatus]|uniref:S-phase kinase-associated protein 2 n=1 Tax=Cyphomyrmex costatus TaxID=456900 RepID=A0A195D4C3_9HYME|nr:S-phase kinase-associated protein 2 [Cyphomyrmex costatus]